MQNRFLNLCGMIALTETVRAACGLDSSTTIENALDLVSNSCGGTDCGLTRLERDGEVEIPSRLTRDGNPFVVTAAADWFEVVADEGGEA